MGQFSYHEKGTSSAKTSDKLNVINYYSLEFLLYII